MTTIAKRTPPPRRFENYVLTRDLSRLSGLCEVDSASMNVINAGGIAGVDDNYSSEIEIGFDFELDGIVYKKFVVCTNGWMCLVDPTTTFNTADVMVNVFDNASINQTFTNNHVLLAPWFSNLITSLNNLNDYSALGIYPNLTGDEVQRTQYGIIVPPTTYDQRQFGLRYKNVSDSENGRFLIVRWDVLSYYANSRLKLRFDVVLYESGKIEFRYAPKENLQISDPDVSETTAIGIFMPGAVAPDWRFRDFTTKLGYREDERQQYIYGGAAYDANYLDYGLPYTIGITAKSNWPARRHGATYVFSPPKIKKKILPNLEVVKNDSLQSYPITKKNFPTQNDVIEFNDEKTIVAGTSVVNFPTLLKRFYGDGEPGIDERQSLFTGDFLVTSSVRLNAIEKFSIAQKSKKIEPFNEFALYEQSDDNLYYASGSSILEFGTALSNRLSSKSIVRFSLPVNRQTRLFETTSSVHYYNTRQAGWYVPRNTSGNDHANALNIIDYASISEDARMFNSLGVLISSGTNPDTPTPYGAFQSDPIIGSQYSTSSFVQALSSLYGKSVLNNEEYHANVDEQIMLPISEPFLIEKVVFEIPFTLGDGWFKDRTTGGRPLNGGGTGITSAYDLAGPGITVSMFNQVKSGPVTYKDLILSGVIIPVGDYTKNVKVDNNFLPERYTFTHEGFLSYGLTPAAIVAPNSSSNIGYNFTGSVIVKTEAGVSNGMLLGIEIFAENPSMPVGTRRSEVTKYLTTEKIGVARSTVTSATEAQINSFVFNVNPFGRASTGFKPSGRSNFGKEFVTLQGVLNSNNKVTNPFYVSSSYDALPEHMKQALSVGSFSGTLMGVIPLESSAASPYLVMPNDKLTIAISKMRPAIYCNGKNPVSGTVADPFTGSLKHDVTLNTGSINVVLYGSFLREGIERDSKSKTNLVSNSVHEVIGDEPILDQYEVEYDGLYYGGIYDDYVSGSLITVKSVNNQSTLVQGSRGRVFSKFFARNQPAPASSPVTDYEVITNPSKAFRLQPWYERVGNVKVVSHKCSSERYYDSMMPSITDCIRIENADITVFDPAEFGVLINSASFEHDIGIVSLNQRGNPNDPTTPPWLLQRVPWAFTFPYEPKYLGLTRMQDANSLLYANKMWTPSTNAHVQIPPRKLNTLVPVIGGGGPYDYQLPGMSAGASGPFDAEATILAMDVNLYKQPYGYPLTGGLGIEDFTKIFFGYGDRKSMRYQNYNTTYGWIQASGTSGYPNSISFREYGATNGSSGNATVGLSPIIRGWKYGIYNGLPTFSKAVFRTNRFGQVRDMLEQRQYTKFYNYKNDISLNHGVGDSVVTVRFVDSDGKTTNPENTWSQNVSLEATSSFPYFDGLTKNRNPIIDYKALNQSIVQLGETITF